MPPSLSTFSPNNCNNTSYFSMEEDKESTELENKSQPLTIFYNGKLVVSHVTDLQVWFFLFLFSVAYCYFRGVGTFCEPIGHSIMTMHDYSFFFLNFLERKDLCTFMNKPYHIVNKMIMLLLFFFFFLFLLFFVVFLNLILYRHDVNYKIKEYFWYVFNLEL